MAPRAAKQQAAKGRRPSEQAAVLAPLTQSTSRSDLVAASIRDAILQGKLEPGATLVERRLADMLGVSKTPVREALISLAATGLVTINVNRGVRVRRLELEDICKLYELRMLLEPWAVAWGDGRRGRMKHEEARRALAEAEELLDGDDSAALSLKNRAFHRALYSRCQNDLVVARLDEIQDLVALGVVNLLWQRWPTWREEYDEHRAILSAAEKGQRDKVERLAREHVERTLERLRSNAVEP